MSGRKRIYNVKEDYFEKWSYNMAYILGFISADGSVNHSSLRIELAIKDREILEFIRNELSPTSLIKITKKKGKKYVRLSINSVKLTKSLQQYSVIPNKTYFIKLNFNIPQQYLKDYIRGLFDGDGWVYCRRNSIESGIVSHSREYLEAISEHLNMGRIRLRKKTTKSGKISICYVLDFGRNESISLRDIMYSSKGFALKRKKKIFFSDFYIPSTRWWTPEQIQYLKDNFRPQTDGLLNELAKKLGKTRSSVSKKIWELNLTKSF